MGSPDQRYPALDGMRALAATAIVVTHCAFDTGAITPDGVGPALARLDVAVPVFFVLSGFLLSLPLFRAAAAGRPPPGVRAFLWRRALRILPAYWVSVVLVMQLVPADRDAGWADWLPQLGLLQVYDTDWTVEGLAQTWSLCTGAAFCIVLPAIGRGLLRLSGPVFRPARVLGALGGSAVAGEAWVAWTAAHGPLHLWLPAVAAWWAAGMAIAVLAAAPGAGRAVRQLAASTGTCWAAAAAVFLVACTSPAGPLDLTRPTAVEAVIKSVLYAAVATLLVLPLVLGNGCSRLHVLLAGRPLRAVGQRSYGLFLFHIPVLVGLDAVTHRAPLTGAFWPTLAVVWGGGLLLAELSLRFLERPLTTWLRERVPDRSEQSPQQQGPERHDPERGVSPRPEQTVVEP